MSEPYQEIQGSNGVECASIPMECAPVRLHVRDFGATPSSANVFYALNDAVEAAKAVNGPAEIVFEPGEIYHIAQPGDSALDGIDACFADQSAWTILNVTNLTIDGQGATLLIMDPEIGGIAMTDSSHIALKNLKIDYDPLPYTQGMITQVDLENYWFELKLDEDSATPDTPNFERARKAFGNWGLTIRDEGNARVRYGSSAIFADRWEKTGDRLWRFHPSRDESNFSGLSNPLRISGLKAGDRYVHMARNWSQAIKAEDCDHVLWEGITVYASPGLAFYPRGTSHHTIRDCHTRLKDGRIFSTTSDGIHARGSRGHLLIEDCSFEGMADDGINVHSSALAVVEVLAPHQVAVKKHTFSVRSGDELIQVRPEVGRVMERAVVQSVRDQGDTWVVTFSEPLADVAADDNFYNLSESASPFVIRNCHFKNFRGRGVLISAHGGTVENCLFEMPEGWGVVLHYETTRWAEGPLAFDLKVLNNTFHGKGSAIHSAIRSEITTPGGAKVEGRPFHNILIEGNRFHDYGKPVMEIHHAREITIRDNRVFNADETPRVRADYAAIELFDSESIAIEKLAVEDRDARQIAAVRIASDCSSDIKIESGTLKLDLAPTSLPVLDQR